MSQAVRLAPLAVAANAHAPGPRCGHSLTAVVGEQGPKLILFGGATALEGTGTNSGSGIRLAGATADVHSFDIRAGEWKKLEPQGEPPSPRAAHAAAAVGSMVVVQGGIGPLGLATEDLHVLDLSGSTARWHRVVVPNQGPGPRYAHVLALVAQRYLVALGGNDGRVSLEDVWSLDTASKPYVWQQIFPEGEKPSARMYSTAAARADGLLLLAGGRDATNAPLADAFGLARHRDGRWEWARAPGVSPSARYQHSAVFVGARLHVSGGALGGGRMVEDSAAWAVLDTEAGQWHAWEGPEVVHISRRCRHSCASVGPLLFLYGGLRGGQLLDDMIVADDSYAEPAKERVDKLIAVIDLNAPPWTTWAEALGVPGLTPDQISPSTMIEDQSQSMHTNTFPALSPPSLQPQVGALSRDDAAIAADAALASSLISLPSDDSGSGRPPLAPGSRSRYTPQQQQITVSTPPTPAVRLHNRVVVVAAGRSPTAGGSHVAGLVRQLSLDQFENEGRRVRDDALPAAVAHTDERMERWSPLERVHAGIGVHKMVIAELLQPREWEPPVERTFFMDVASIEELCSLAENCFKAEPTVLQLSAPVKIFGDLHGQFGDLMRLFDEYGSPSTAGDIAYIDYLFLGDYVDRGSHSLETIMLLLALKVEHPSNIHLIRGNHEAADINAQFGFRMECVERLGERGLYVWQRLNSLFNWLPLAALIERKILCMHGGIGRSIESVREIEALQRPLTMETGGITLMDLLWSDPTESDFVEGVHPNARGPGLVSFGPDRVHSFCEANDLQLIVRAHECVMDGFERFAQGHMITVFSATNYCGTANNAGAILVLGRDLVVVPKLIHPLPPEAMHREQGSDVSPITASSGPTPAAPWLESINRERPPTPPRGRPSVRSSAGSQERGSLAWI
ncbi:Serine/threonine-protein phosphatase bsl2 [Cymbomonas tetramitiformis]|uniref:Serine/threonine-protein phosphatase n=1 Tax=Cymbomonas tetramitiformis TaxID=36881 RepID=A0AAE0BYS7_9CHLO|nr:Serine/threonine-protein phosphatase bsl2 [Cymbomonas tetramitiformis]